MAMSKAFLGHGIFVELRPINALRRYANYKKPLPPKHTTSDLVDKFIEALTDMKMSSVWFQIFSSFGTIDKDGKQGTKELVDGLKAAGIAAIPWGYCFGQNSEADPSDPNKVLDLERAKRLCGNYGLDVFVADIEPWNDSSHGIDEWKADALQALMAGLNQHFGKDSLGISSFALLDKNSQPHARELLPPVAPLVSFCAPQIYWGGGKRDPVAWAKKSLKSWKDAGVTTELIATVQCYWEKGAPRKTMEAKVEQFIAGFTSADWSQIVGLNWYHAGGANTAKEGAMSQAMIDAIIAGHLDQKPYKTPGTARPHSEAGAPAARAHP